MLCAVVTSGDFSTRELLQERQAYTAGANTWDLIQHVNPRMRFIVAMRDPVERLYSDFVYFSTVGDSKRITAKYFHEQVERQVDWWHTCVQRHDERRCLYGGDVEGMKPLRVQHNTCWLETFTDEDDAVCAAFRVGLYYYYIRDWLDTFPRDQFLFISTERYSESAINVINSEVLMFLDLEPFYGEQEDVVKNMPKQFPLKEDAKRRLRQRNFMSNKMLPETRSLLQEFYRPSNQLLADFLQNEDFLWYDK